VFKRLVFVLLFPGIAQVFHSCSLFAFTYSIQLLARDTSALLHFLSVFACILLYRLGISAFVSCSTRRDFLILFSRINLDSPNPRVRKDSERALKQEIAWAQHIACPAVLAPTPAKECPNFARALYASFTGKYPFSALAALGIFCCCR
jgi:hypothetical protein